MRALKHRVAKVLGRRACPVLSVLHTRGHLPLYTCFSVQITVGYASYPLTVFLGGGVLVLRP